MNPSSKSQVAGINVSQSLIQALYDEIPCLGSENLFKGPIVR